MRRAIDLVRLVLVSLEFVAVLTPILAWHYHPEWVNTLVKPMKESLFLGLGAAGLALGATTFCYKEGGDILDPTGAKAVLLEWPGYFMLKARVVAALAWCTAGIVAALTATWMVASDINPQLGASILVAGVLAAAAATGSIALARYRIRELIPSK